MTTGDAPVVEPPRATPLTAQEDPEIARILEEKGWRSLLDMHQAQHFAQHCCLRNRWVRDPNAVKRHLSQAHVEQWKQVASRLEARCAEIKHLLDRDGVCPWCTRVSYSRHFKQCNIVFQRALLGLLHEDGRGGRVGVRRLAAGSVSPTERVNEEAQGTRTERRAAWQARRGQRGNRQRIQPDNLNNVVSILAALSLQQEDALNRVRLDSSHTFHLEQTGQGAILKSLYEAGRSWHEKKGQGVPLPALRTVVFALLVTETKARLTLFAQDPNAVKAAVERKVMNPSKQFVFQRWNPKEQKLEQDPDRNALSVEQIQQLLQELGTHCKDNIITKFNSVRKMKREPEENEKAVFVVEIALNRPDPGIGDARINPLGYLPED